MGGRERQRGKLTGVHSCLIYISYSNNNNDDDDDDDDDDNDYSPPSWVNKILTDLINRKQR